MSRQVFFSAAPRPPQYLTWLATLVVSAFVACGPQEGGELLKSAEVQSVRSALSHDSSPYGKAYFSATGVNCYKSGSNYVCAIDLRYAHVRSVHGDIYPGTESFGLHTVWDYWNGAASMDGGGKKVVAVNMSFFDYHPATTSPREISFPYKQDGNTIPLTYGKDCSARDYTLYRKLLHVWNDRGYADVGDYLCTSSYDQDQLHTYGSAPNIIGGLEQTVPVGADRTNRTFMGVLDNDGDGYFYETLLIFSTSGNLTQAEAASQLTAFGGGKTVKVVMFDGSGSAQMVINGTSVVPNGRLVPNALIVYAP